MHLGRVICAREKNEDGGASGPQAVSPLPQPGATPLSPLLSLMRELLEHCETAGSKVCCSLFLPVTSPPSLSFPLCKWGS